MAAAPAVAVLGAGAWGTALACVAAANGSPVVLWTRDPDHAARLSATRDHPGLPGVTLPPGIVPTASLAATAAADAIVFATPAQTLDEVARRLAEHLPAGYAPPAVITPKGIEATTGRLMHEVLAAALPGARASVLSGPGFAEDVARGLPTAATLATADRTLGARMVALFARPAFRPYLSNDLVGVELGGAVKNVLAIAAGIVTGRGLGDGARAALIARGLAEMTRLGIAMGARRETFAGLSGLGDLVLTATSPRSRNTALGIALGEGRALAELVRPGAPLAEGVFTAGVVARMAADRGVDMPIVAAVAAVVSGRIGIDDAIASILDRPLRSE